MNNFWEWVKTSSYKGLVDLEGIDRKMLSDVTKRGKFTHKYKNGKPCNGWKITGPATIIDKLTKATKRGYFSLVFNSTQVFIIFQNKIFRMPRFNLKSNPNFKRALIYAKKQAIPLFYLKEIEDTFW